MIFVLVLFITGNLNDEKLVLTWLESHKDLEGDVIEDISSTLLPTLIENSTFLAVLFCKNAISL